MVWQKSSKCFPATGSSKTLPLAWLYHGCLAFQFAYIGHDDMTCREEFGTPAEKHRQTFPIFSRPTRPSHTKSLKRWDRRFPRAKCPMPKKNCFSSIQMGDGPLCRKISLLCPLPHQKRREPLSSTSSFALLH